MKPVFYSLEFTYFDGAAWDSQTKTIIALNKTSLIRSFLNETCVIHHETSRELWESVRKNIVEHTMDRFPLVFNGEFYF